LLAENHVFRTLQGGIAQDSRPRLFEWKSAVFFSQLTKDSLKVLGSLPSGALKSVMRHDGPDSEMVSSLDQPVCELRCGYDYLVDPGPIS
jgi:hypothetical protein